MHRPTLAAAALVTTAFTFSGTPAAAHTCKTKRCRTHKIHRVMPFCNTWSCVHRVARKRARRWDRSHPWTTVTASWYGPGLYGNRTACGQTLTPGTAGVAHKTFACGTRLQLCARACTITTVIDRGPYVAGRTFDLTAPVRAAIGAGELGLIRYRLAR